MTRVATLGQHNRTLAHIQNTQGSFDKAQLQIASGKKADDYAGIARDASRLVSLEASHVKVTQYIANNQTVDRRLQSMESSVSQIFDVISGFKTLLVNALNVNNATDLAMTTQAQSALTQIAALLNVQGDGRYLFSGAATTTAPVDVTALPAVYIVPTVDGASSAYYRGDAQAPSIKADDSLVVTYGVTASEPAFERAIRALDVVIKNGPANRATLDHALAVINLAIDDVSDARSKIGAARATLQDANKTHQDFLLYAEQTISDLENVDVAEAISRLNSAQTSLEASYLSVSRLSQLTLMNYLR